MQPYETTVGVDFAIKGNSVVLKCGIPSFVADFVNVITWLAGDTEIYPSDNYGLYILHYYFNIVPHSYFDSLFSNIILLKSFSYRCYIKYHLNSVSHSGLPIL